MKMDTPDKTQITPPPLSKFEDSPVFKFIDSLSPIELAKSGQTDNAFSSLAFLSPSSLFPSPQINCHRESRFSVKRHHFLAESSNSRVLQSGNEANTSEGAPKAFEQSALAVELPRTSKYDCESPSGNLAPCDKILENTSLEAAGQESSPFQRHRDEWKERQVSFENERDLRKIRRIKPSEESAGCGWVAVVSDVADMLTVNTSIIHENTDGQDQRQADSGTTSFISNSAECLIDNANNLGKTDSGDHQGFCKQNELVEPLTDQTSGVPTSLPDKLVVSDLGLKKDDKGEKFNQFSRQRSIRRRCLVFEKSPGFGLHLSSLPNILKAGQNPPNKSILSSLKRVEVPSDNETAVTENSSETPATVGGNDPDHNTPEMKRQKFELVEESASCKRCNCKRSKCLKLYCECFAAGLYCIEPCSCLDCFNKPIHENVVLETRKQIESRNPQAFAPKVIRSTDNVFDSGGENNKTPASARHKRGCNCKKSSCLKKYCECFQEGVGCSPSCRCEGCKNSFGRKDGCNESESESEGESLGASERKALEKSSNDVVIYKKSDELQDLSVHNLDL